MKLLVLIKSCCILLFGFFVFGGEMVCATEKLVLQLPWHHQFQFAGYYMAKEQGYYRDAGFDVEIRDATQGATPVAAVFSGQADFGVSNSGLLVERSLGKPIVIIAAVFQRSPAIFLALKQSGICEPTDLIGKKVMLSPGFQSLALIALLHQEKLFNKIERVETSFDVNSLLNRQTDVFNAYRTNEPYLLESQGYLTAVIDPEDYGIHFYGDILFTSETFLKDRPKSLEKFRKASLKGWEYALAHPDAAIEIIKSEYQVAKSVEHLQFEAAAIREVIQPDLIEIGHIDLARWAQISRHLIAIGAISPNFYLTADFFYKPPPGIHWEKLRFWIIGISAAFVALLFFLSILFKANLRLKIVRKQLQKEMQEREQTERERMELEEQLRQSYKMEAIGIMAGGIAHDFNNSLAIILGNVELSQLKLPPGSEVIGHLQQAKTAILQARDLVQQILVYSRQGGENLRPVKISMVIDEVLNLLSSTIPSTVEIVNMIQKTDKDIIIFADSTQLQQIVINLCNNAVYAMEKKGRLEVALESVELSTDDLPAGKTLEAGLFAKLSIKDSGKGMSSEVLKKIFDPFFTTKGIGEGTGMGLSVVHGIVSSHGGFITADSIPGKGSIFQIYFPIIKEKPVAKISEIEELPTGNERIIIVDDEEVLADIGRQMLIEHGYQVTMKTSSKDVVAMFKEDPDQFDLVITDQTMPELSGIELAEELLKIRPDLPIILCSGYGTEDFAAVAKQVGIREFCKKPLNLPQLIQVTRRVLDKVDQQNR